MFKPILLVFIAFTQLSVNAAEPNLKPLPVLQHHAGKAQLSERSPLRLIRSPEPGWLDDSTEEKEVDSSKKAKSDKPEIAGEIYLPEGYNKLEVPKGRIFGEVIDIETPVSVHLNILSIGDINEADEEIGFEMDTIVEWVDAGLVTDAFGSSDEDSFDNIVAQHQKTLDPTFLKKIWKPDLFIENLISVTQPDLMGKPARLKFSTSGRITYSTRVKVRVHCDFDFQYYPAETQKCNIRLRSYAHNSSELELRWRRPIGVFLVSPDDENFDITVDYVRRFQIITQVGHVGKMEEKFDCIQFTLLARRRLSYHLVQTYIPSALFIGITWVCFLIPKQMIEARMAIVMTTLLTLTSMFSSVRESTPAVSYTKAIDIWMVVCVGLVFMVLVQFAVLLWAFTEKKAEQEEQERLAMMNRRADASKTAQKKYRRGFRQSVVHVAMVVVTFMEAFNFAIALLIFVLFSTLYWGWLLKYSGYFDWSVNPLHNAIEIDDDNATETQMLGERIFQELTPFN